MRMKNEAKRLNATILSLKDMRENVGDKELKADIFDAVIELREVQMQLDNKWDLPSMIIGGLVATAVSLLLCNTAEADTLDLNITSWHQDKSYNYNTKNYGIGYTKDIDHHWQLQGGFYNNSYNKLSTYALVNLKHDMKNWNWGIAFGFVTGYDDIDDTNKLQSKYSNMQKSYRRRGHKKDKNEHRREKHGYEKGSHNHAKNLNAAQFMILPNVTWKINNKHALNLTVVPAFTKDTFAFAGLKYKYTLGD